MPARVTIEATVWSDSRYHVLAQSLGCTHYEAIGRMAAIWGECADRETDRFASVFVSVHLGCKPEDAIHALVQANLGEDMGDGVVRIRGCRNRTEWLAKKRANGALGGRPRKQAKSKTKSVAKTRKPSSDVRFSETKPNPDLGYDFNNPIAPAPAPAPASSLREPSAGTHTPARDMGESESNDAPADRYAEIYRLWCARGQRAVDEANANPERRSKLTWSPLPEYNLRHRIAEALNHTECLGLSHAQIAHGLEMLVAEGLAKPVDDPDPFRWLRECWDGKRLATAIAIPSAEAARARASPSERRPKKQQESDRERAKRLAALASGGAR